MQIGPQQQAGTLPASVSCKASRMWVSLACRALVGSPRNQWKRRRKGGIRRAGACRGLGGGRVNGALVVAIGARGTAGNVFLRGFIATCHEKSSENPRSATLIAFPRVSHLSGYSWPAQPCTRQGQPMKNISARRDMMDLKGGLFCF